MLKYCTESDNMEMDVQVGPGQELTAGIKEGCGKSEGCCKSEGCGKSEGGYTPNPTYKSGEGTLYPRSKLYAAKKDADTVTVAGKTNREGCCEFYVDAYDVEKHAMFNEQSMLESLNDIIMCNEAEGMTAQNTIIVVDESTMGYVRSLEKHGATCMRFVSEASVQDIEMQVQVGPEKDEVIVKADPQDANPVDAVKRNYDTVVVAKNDKEFFMDVEDVQKCAEVRCESVIDTINGIIACHEEVDMNTENVVIACGKNSVYESTLEEFDECGVNYIFDF